jgi:hypothetical protein
MKTKLSNLRLSLMILILIVFNQVVLSQTFSDEIIDYIPQYILPNEYVYGMNEWIFGDACSDIAEVGGDNANDALAAQQMALFNIRAGQMPIFTYYRWNYFGIDLCNQFLKLTNGKILSAVKQEQRAKILFYRALLYFNLVRLYGDIPLYTENDVSTIDSSSIATIYNNYMPVIQSDTLHKARTAASEIWQQIDNDLTVAVPLLPKNSSLDSSEWYRVTQGAALTLMAKSKLYQKNWQAALDYSRQVINSGEYSLEDNFSEAFSINKHGKESIFELEQYPSAYVDFPGLPVVYGEYWASFNHNVLYNPRHVLFVSESIGSIPNSYYGWGFNCPSIKYVESFISGDPRQKYTILSPDDSIIWYVNTDTIYAIMDTTASIYNDPTGGKSPTGYSQRKYFITGTDAFLSGVSEDVISNTYILPHSGGYKNIRVFRFADVILMAAEAHYELGNADSALYYVNQIRTRARNSGNTGYPKNLTSITIDSIYNERMWELGGEGYRLFDLIRTRKAYEAIDGTYNNTFHCIVHFDTMKNYLFPIPLQDIVMSQGILTQNPGYETIDDIEDIVVTRPFKNYVFEIDTSSYHFSYTAPSKTDTLNSHFDLENTLELGIIPKFAFKNSTNQAEYIAHIDNPDVNGDYKAQIYSYSFQYWTKDTIEEYPFIDTIFVTATNYKDTVSTSFTMILTPRIISSIEQKGVNPEFFVVPNPTSNRITVTLNQSPEKDCFYEIYSVSGTLLIRGITEHQNFQIDLSIFPAGMYYLRIPGINKSEKILKIQ